MTQRFRPARPAAYLPHLDAAARCFAAVLATGDLDAPVPGCPRWDLRALGQHLGNGHRLIRGAVLEGHPNTPPVPAPAAQADLAAWYRDCAGALLATLRGTEPTQSCWSLGDPPTAGFWFRRATHETALHTLDALASQRPGGPDSPGPPDPSAADPWLADPWLADAWLADAWQPDPWLAADGVDEVASFFLPFLVAAGAKTALGASLAVEVTLPAADPPKPAGGWRWVLAADGTGPAAAPDAPAQACVRGAAVTVLRLLWGRIALADSGLTVTGDVAAARAVLAHGLTT